MPAAESCAYRGQCCSCAQTDEESTDKGAVIPVYLTTEIYDFDPATAYTDDAATKILGMVYEGLYKFDKNGKVVPGIASDYKIKEDPESGLYELEIYLKETAWSDGRSVQAADFVYAIKRVLEPEFRGEAAAMLMEIKNARAVKAGDMSIDDLGVYDSDTKVIQIQFERKIDYEAFLAILASPMLYPVRETLLRRLPTGRPTPDLVCNGPFVAYFRARQNIILNATYITIATSKTINRQVCKPYRLAINL